MSASDKANTVLFINPEQASRVLATCYTANVPTHFIGGPSTAKTTFHKSFVARVNDNSMADTSKKRKPFKLWPVHLSSCDMGDFMLPVPNHEKRRVEYYTTEMLPFDEPDARGLVLFDDLTKARPELQPFVMNCLLDKFFHSHTIADTVMMSATSNGTSDMYNSEVCDALKTRSCNLFVSAGAQGFAESWDKWAGEQGLLPETRAFRRYCSDSLVVKEQFEEWATFTDRSLAMADRITQSCSRAGFPTDDIYLPMVAGCIGRANAIKYMEIGRLAREAPSPETVVADPDKAPIPENVSVVFAMTCVLVNLANKENAEQIGKYAIRLPTAHALVLIKSIKDKAGCNGIMLNRNVQKWAIDHKSILM
jgi:hypothetical protein